MNDQFLNIPLWGLAASYAVLLPVLLIVFRERMKLGRNLLISVLRMSVQLILVGYLLTYIFAMRDWWVVVVLYLFMVYFAARTVVGRTGIKISRLDLLLFVSMLAGTGAMTALLVIFVLPLDNWWEPRFFIPLAGMVIGNSMNACSLAVDRFIRGLKDNRTKVETLLSLGANSYQASGQVRRDSLRAALLPTLGNMSGVGIVFLPGMMTGQILGGVDPLDAIRYQLVIMLAILGSVAISCYLILALERRLVFDDIHLIRESVFDNLD